MSVDSAEPIAVGFRKLRDIGGGSIGVSVDLDALRELDLVDEDGQLKEDVTVRQVIRDDGTVSVDLPARDD